VQLDLIRHEHDAPADRMRSLGAERPTINRVAAPV